MQTEDSVIVGLAHDWHGVGGLDRQDIAMLDFAEKVTKEASSCTREDVDNLKALGFSDEEVLEIVLVCCWYAVRTRLADALGVELDEGMRQNENLVQAFAFDHQDRAGARTYGIIKRDNG